MSDYIPVSYLNLRQLIPQKDVCKLIYGMLNEYDCKVVICAHNSKRKVKLTVDFSNYCARYGYLRLLKWAISRGCPWDSRVYEMAAWRGHLHVIQWAKSKGCVWNAYICECAAKGGQLAILKWLRAHGCQWDEWTCAGAAAWGHLEVLKWARVNKCPWDRVASYRVAELNDHSNIMQWIRDQ